MASKIKVIGAKEHNLKNISVEIPKDTLSVITGPSGSGKSSLAMDTIFAEGQRRYVESLSAYVRQFLGVHKKPDVEKIEGLCPAIAIDQKTTGFNPRSTVGTVTEIYDYLRVLYARLGEVHCPLCNAVLKEQTPEGILQILLHQYKDSEILIFAVIASHKKGDFRSTINNYYNHGYSTFLINGKLEKITQKQQIEFLRFGKTLFHTVAVMVEKVLVNHLNIDYLFEGIKKAFAITKASCSIATIEKPTELQTFSSAKFCTPCVYSFPLLEPRLFSFNSPIGACKRCEGLGVVYSWPSFISQKAEALEDAALSNFGEETCKECSGARINEAARAVKIKDAGIFDLCNLSLKKLQAFFAELSFQGQDKKISERLMHDIFERISFLVNVGLDYLTLARASRSLSGGESQRIRLATQIGSALTGVLYVLDEPSIGLHQRDNDKLITTLKRLRDLGNTVIVVEHDQETMMEADFIVDMGPASGVFGGEVVAVGNPSEIINSKTSVTGPYLAGAKKVEVPKSRREAKKFLSMIEATKNNLKNLSVSIPLETFVAVTGVSGSGKSSLIMQTLVPVLESYFNRGYAVGANLKSLQGAELLKSVVSVDQKPIGRTSRSNPATYIGIFNDIRSIFAGLPESKAKGYEMGHFSFNVAGGRCEECKGDGKIKISMQFLEDVVIVCKNCQGERYDPFVLSIRFRGKNISDVLKMSAVEAKEHFQGFNSITKKLDLMCDVGLDYIALGQASSTISGGESQRIKLVNELSKRGSSTLYVLDEPTTGLHFVDIVKLLKCLNQLVDKGNSVIVIEHNLDVIKCADFIIDVGPNGGDSGGEIVFSGTPEDLIKSESVTGKYLKKYLS